MMDARRPITNPSRTTEASTWRRGASERAQRRELTRALCDGDRQRVEDDERADEQGDAAEPEQEVRDERDPLVRVGRVGRGLRGAGLHLRGSGHERLERLNELVRGNALLRRNRDGVEVALLPEEGLRSRHVEDGERRPADRVDRSEPRDTRDLVLLEGPSAATPTVSPTPTPSLLAVFASITTWSAPRAHFPSVRLRGEKRRCSASSPTPNVGAPPLPPIFLPSGLTSCAGFEFDWMSKMPPAASSTSGAHDLVEDARGDGRASARGKLEQLLAADDGVVSAYDSLKMLSNAFWNVSVRTFVPLIIATPRTNGER